MMFLRTVLLLAVLAITAASNKQDQQTTTIITIQCQLPPILFGTPALDIQQEQQQVIQFYQQLYGDHAVTVIATTQKLYNAIFMQIPATRESTQHQRRRLQQQQQQHQQQQQQQPGVARILSHQVLLIEHEEIMQTDQDVESRQLQDINDQCWTGHNVTVGIVDSGIDYTHAALGGSGRFLDYQAALLGMEQRNPLLFPTDRVIEGYDIIGDLEQGVSDDNPIDIHGHGTYVASALLSVAPHAKLIAAKTCTPKGRCPDFAVILGLEYLVEQKVDIINISLGSSFTSPYFEAVAAAFENAFALGIVVVTSVGNGGNIPYVAGALGTTPNVIAVAATTAPTTDDSQNGTTTAAMISMQPYSARGPGENNALKPDISAPSGLRLARVGSGSRLGIAQGTSFSSPIVAGTAALLLQKCYSQQQACSPFFIKSVLMNNARTDIQNDMAPLSRMGSGEVSHQALNAPIWAYSVQDVQPSISLGLLDVSSENRFITMTRTIAVSDLETLVNGGQREIFVTAQIRGHHHASKLPLDISFNATTQIMMDGRAEVEVIFRIDVEKVPTSRMGGSQDNNSMDRHEFGGHIHLTTSSVSKDRVEYMHRIVVPFHMILRKASKVEFVSDDVGDDPIRRRHVHEMDGNRPIILKNYGSGKAQIDSFHILALDPDDDEGGYASGQPSSDIRSVGYRVVPLNGGGINLDCEYLVEFAFHAWERTKRIGMTSYRAHIYSDGDLEQPPFILFNPGVPDSDRGCMILDPSTGNSKCTGFLPDHASNSAVTVIRACAKDVGLTKTEQLFAVHFEAEAFPLDEQTEIDRTDVILDVLFPNRLPSPSYDIPPGETLTFPERISSFPINAAAGLLLITNAYRDENKTGASTAESEVLYIVTKELDEAITDHWNTSTLSLPWNLPVAQKLHGPGGQWKSSPADNGCEISMGEEADIDDNNDGVQPEMMPLEKAVLENEFQKATKVQDIEYCTLMDVPRVPISTPDQGPATGSPTVYLRNETELDAAKIENGEDFPSPGDKEPAADLPSSSATAIMSWLDTSTITFLLALSGWLNYNP